MAVPVDYKADEIPVQVILAESVPAEVPVAVVKEETKSLPVDEAAQKQVLVTAVVLTDEPAKTPLLKVAEEPKVEEPKVEEPKVEEPKVEEPKVEEKEPAKEVAKETADDLDASTAAEKKSDEPVKAEDDKSKDEDKSKDLETQSSVWAAPAWGSAPAVYSSAWPVAVPVASSYHGGWSHYPKAYPYYYQPTTHYSSHYSSPSYWPSYVSNGWW